MDYITYNGTDAGLTNQKIAIIGLSHRAMREKKGIKLPPMVVFDPLQAEKGRRVPFSVLYNIENIVRVLESFSIPVKEFASGDDHDVDASECFWEGAERFGEIRTQGDAALYDLTCQISRSFNLNNNILNLARPISECIFGEKKIDYCIQMRIEKDWESYSYSVLHRHSSEDNFPTPLRILSKAKRKFGESLSSAFVMSDEKNMTIPKEDINKIAQNEVGVSLFWKSDFIDVSQYDSLTLSMIDFFLASGARNFIGTSQSTFSCFAAFEKYCKTRQSVRGHYIYNGESGGIDERFDNGICTNSSLAIDRTFLREPFFDRTPHDVAFPMEISAHVSNFGEYITKNSVCSFPLGLDIVVGSRYNPDMYRIEGFFISLDGASLRLRYKALLGNGVETEWVSNGEYCGTRGKHLSLSGFAVEIVGPSRLELECVYAAVFSEDQDIVTAKDGELCKTPSGNGKLLSFQLSFRKRVR
ncbi:hypothetical protein [Gluconacetobacter sacchari]|uniref:Uncharacterized protein n=1 Tax=Gluconacetobacter sacchari TaxID=92759 RepID=A0A7W4NNY4_9PROT|nr:hypothetical protein [Gluconacetobacter sacchari]MBB2161279.1 hypothetical protein [Gluconacetobacter sacchari]